MTFWTDVYPHKVWTNILTFKGKYMDYKIGKDKRDWETWTFAWNKEIIDNTDELNIISFYEIVNNSDEHSSAFDKGNGIVDTFINNYGKYKY